MQGELLKSFLVGLGFGVDDASYKNFTKAITSATLKVSALYGSIQATTSAVSFGISKISESFEQLGYEYKIIAPAINKAILLRQEMLKAYSAAGVNLTKVVQSALKLNMSVTKTKYAFEALYKSVAARFFPLLTKQSDLFRKKLYDNMPKIQASLERFIKFLFSAFEATITLGTRLYSILGRVYDFFLSLHRATDGWSTVLLALVAAWQFLNLAFLNTPLGRIIAGFTVLLALWDDLKTFKEGGQSLIDWGSSMTQVIVGLGAAIGTVVAAFYAWKAIVFATNVVLGVMDALLVIAEAPFLAIAAAIGVIVAGLTLADEKWQIFGGHLSGFFGGIGNKVLDFIGGPNVSSNLGAGQSPTSVSPLGGWGASHSQTNQNVQQQTNISVQGSADAAATAKAVTSQQSRVNFDMARNLKSVTAPTGIPR